MKNLESYRNEYLNDQGYEAIIAHFRRRKVCEYLDRYRPRNVLEIGCGVESIAGHWTAYERIDVVEPIAEFITHAQKNLADTAPSNQPKVHFHHGFFENVSSAWQVRHDFVVLSSLLHEVPDPDLFLQNLYSRMGSGAILHVNVPNASSLHNRLAVKMNLLKDIFDRSPTAQKFQRVSTFDTDKLLTLLKKTGFEILEHETYFLKPFANFQMLEIWKRNDIFPRELFEAFYDISNELPGLGLEIAINVRKPAI